MGIALSEEQAELGQVVRSFLAGAGSVRAARRCLEAGLRDEIGGGDAAGPPGLWRAAADLGWFGVHVPESAGGGGAGLVELAVVAEEFGRAGTPGPLLPVTVGADILAGSGHHRQVLAGLLDGSLTAGLAVDAEVDLADGRLQGRATLVGGPRADVVLVAVGDDVAVVHSAAPGVTLRARSQLDPSLPLVEASFREVAVQPADSLHGAAGAAAHLTDLVVAALAVGGAAACRDIAVSYAKDREAFGRPIGQFQAVKHSCADRYVAEQLATGLTWDAALAGRGDRGRLLAGAAVDVAVDAFWHAATALTQILGGIGFTWEHDAHLYLRRAATLRALRGGTLDRRRALVARLALAADAAAEPDGAAGDELPSARAAREAARRFAVEHAAVGAADRVAHLVDRGYLYPHWPAPWGLAADAAEQVAIKQELAGIARFEHLGPTAWELPIVLPTVIVHGTAPQQEAWIRPTMLGQLSWCQLFSEPGAGSDLAAVATRAEPVAGGWQVSGQKVWTSTAHHADLGLALVRTDPVAARHHGISCLVVDMRSPGITIRPLRQITGDAEFNEVFLDAVFVPAENLLGDLHGGWSVARTALEFERGGAGGTDPRPDQLTSATVLAPDQWDLCARHWTWMRDHVLDTGVGLDDVGALAEVDLALRALRRRAAARIAMGGRGSGEGSVIRLATTTHVQRFAEIGHGLLGLEGGFTDGDGSASQLILHTRMATIAGGTSEIQRNVIAERVLGLPRDPKP